MKIIRPKTYDIVDPNTKRFTEQLYKLFNRNISFGRGINTNDQNIDGKMIELTNTGPANTEVVVTHNLDRVPLFVDFKYKNVSGDWLDSGTTWTKNNIYIKFTTANMHVRLFIH